MTDQQAPATTSHPAPDPNGRQFVLIVVGVTVLVAIAIAIYVWDQWRLDDPVVGVTEVAVRDNTFGPESVEIPAGTMITWVWEGREPHNVVGDAFESAVQTEGTFAHTFATAGSFDYECTLHTFMRGRVIVTEPVS